ncbi:MAG: hypothetical protein KDD44_03565, partial [Bdellovibrionales bacterium]|nr:hypothetical protein [Bdellovibrionales bacterium]
EQQAAELFSSVQAMLPAASAEAASDDVPAGQTALPVGFESNIKLLDGSFSGGTYAQFADIYQAIALIRTGDYQGADSLLKPYENVATQSGNGQPAIDGERLSAELATLVRAKALLLIPERRDEAMRLLQALMGNAVIVPAEAAIVRVRSAADPNERAAAIASVRQFVTDRPTFYDEVEQALSPLGISFAPTS